jgi:hypothetical protein
MSLLATAPVAIFPLKPQRVREKVLFSFSGPDQGGDKALRGIPFPGQELTFLMIGFGPPLYRMTQGESIGERC